MIFTGYENASNGSIPEYRFNPDGTVDFRSIPTRISHGRILADDELPATLPSPECRVIKKSALQADWRPLKNKKSHSYKLAEAQALKKGWKPQ